LQDLTGSKLIDKALGSGLVSSLIAGDELGLEADAPQPHAPQPHMKPAAGKAAAQAKPK